MHGYRLRHLVDDDTQLEHQHVALDAGPSALERGEWCEQDLALEWVLRAPRHIAAAVDEPLLDLVDDPAAFAARRVPEGAQGSTDRGDQIGGTLDI